MLDSMSTRNSTPLRTVDRDWTPIESRLEARGLQHGDRVVAVATVDRTSITILGYGVYQHSTTAEDDRAALDRVANALRAMDRLGVDHEPLIDGACRHLSKGQAEAQRTRFHTIESRRRAQPIEHRARVMLDRVHHRRRVRLDSGHVIDADGCFVMRADTFQRYSAGSIVTKATVTA